MDEITQIKQTLNIVDVLQGYVGLKKAGRNYKGTCPFHSENTASFMVSPELQIYKCFGCGESGDVFTFVQKIEGIEFFPALEILAERAGVKLTKKRSDPLAKEKKQIYKINEETANFYNFLLTKHTVGKKGLDYLKTKRSLTNKTIKKFKLGYAPNDWDILYKYLTKKEYTTDELLLAGVTIKKRSNNGYLDKFRGRIIFPLIDVGGKIVGFTGRTAFDKKPKYLNTQETAVFHKSTYLYGLEQSKVALKKEGCVFVEGQVDVITAHQAGIKNVVASSGTSLTLQQLKLVARYTDIVTFCFDPDNAGNAATTRAIDIAETLDLNIKAAMIPKKFGDLDELINHNKAKANTVIDNAVPVYDFFVATAIDKYDKNTAFGKKQIIAELKPRLNKINNMAVKDHYVKLLSKELSLDTATLNKMLDENKQNTAISDTMISIERSLSKKQDIELQEYVLALVFKAKLDLAQNILYKLGRKDFTDENVRNVFTKLKAYLTGRKRKFDIKYFVNTLDDALKKKVEDIYLININELSSNEPLFETELKAVFRRLKNITINRELLKTQEELKVAELEGDEDRLKLLAQKVYKISKLKKHYE